MMSERMSEREFDELLIRRTNRDGTAERLCSVAHAEITAFRAEVERLRTEVERLRTALKIAKASLADIGVDDALVSIDAALTQEKKR